MRLNAKAEKAGRSYGCPNCSAPGKVPTPRALVPVKPRVIVEDPISLPTPARRRKRHGDDPVPVEPPFIVPEIIEDYEPVLVPARRKNRREDDEKPVKLRLGELAELDVEVDRDTRKTIATGFLSGLLVALGAIVVLMFGGRGRSA